MSNRRIEFDYTATSYEQIEGLTRQAQALRSQMLAQGAKWVLRQAYAGLHWLVGLEWADAARRRQDELGLRHLRASRPDHLQPLAPTHAGTQGDKLAVAGRKAGRVAKDDEKARAA